MPTRVAVITWPCLRVIRSRVSRSAGARCRSRCQIVLIPAMGQNVGVRHSLQFPSTFLRSVLHIARYLSRRKCQSLMSRSLSNCRCRTAVCRLRPVTLRDWSVHLNGDRCCRRVCRACEAAVVDLAVHALLVLVGMESGLVRSIGRGQLCQEQRAVHICRARSLGWRHSRSKDRCDSFGSLRCEDRIIDFISSCFLWSLPCRPQVVFVVRGDLP